MLSITCPHCSHELDDTELKRLFAQRGSVDGVRGYLKTGDVSSVDFPPPGLTPAEKLLGHGANFEEAADVLGNSPEIIRKHYGEWSAARQSRTIA